MSIERMQNFLGSAINFFCGDGSQAPEITIRLPTGCGDCGEEDDSELFDYLPTNAPSNEEEVISSNQPESQ